MTKDAARLVILSRAKDLARGREKVLGSPAELSLVTSGQDKAVTSPSPLAGGALFLE
jgi:hypothetical protein